MTLQRNSTLVGSLIGPRGVGKSTLGEYIASNTNTTHFDLDRRVDSTLPGGITAFVEAHGGRTERAAWLAFAAHSQEYLATAMQTPNFNALLDIGGGAAVDPNPRTAETQEALRQYGPIILLLPGGDYETAIDLLAQREALRPRHHGLDFAPIRERAALHYSERLPKYLSIATNIVYMRNGSTARTVQDIADEVATLF